MNMLFRLAPLLLFASLCHAQEDAALSAVRSRIEGERKKAEATFSAQEKTCYGKFAVNDCLNTARAQRRAALADLRRQENSINDAQRKRNAAAHLRAMEGRSSPEKQQEDAQRRDEAAAAQRDREARAARKAADRASSAASAPASAAARHAQAQRRQTEASAARSRRDAEAQMNRKRHDERVKDAQDRKAGVEKRLAERKKPAAQPLPVPP
ncbi:MAG: hypothetical protein ABIU58_04255 [Ramlibacter sp.]